MSSSRRGFLKATAAGSAAVFLGCGTTSGDGDAGPPPDGSLEAILLAATFGLGVASGDVTADSAILWTRYDGAMALSLVVWDAANALVFDGIVAPLAGGFVHADVGGLSSGVRHRFAFFESVGGERTARSPVGAFRTTPAADVMAPLVVGAVSCMKNDREKTPLRRLTDHDDFDVFLLVGDTTYNDGAETLSEFRDKWAESLASEGLRALRETTSVLATWDDHEVSNNFDPEVDDTTVARRAFFENLPLRPDATDPDRIWKSVRWGLTAEIFVLDTRGERRPSTRGTEDIFVSRAQMDWLKAGLRASPCRFKLIVSSIPIGDFPILSESDRWEAYPGQRDELLGLIEDEPIDGCLFVGGDFHFASVGRVGAAGCLGENIPEVLVGPGAQVGNPSAFLLRSDQWDWSSVTNNYARLTLEPAAGRITVTWHDGDDDVIHRQEISV